MTTIVGRHEQMGTVKPGSRRVARLPVVSKN